MLKRILVTFQERHIISELNYDMIYIFRSPVGNLNSGQNYPYPSQGDVLNLIEVRGTQRMTNRGMKILELEPRAPGHSFDPRTLKLDMITHICQSDCQKS